jgi:putative membrane protein insertion efficiency factor
MIALLSVLFLFPRNAVIVVLRFYRLAISPFYGDVCRYYPSCSAYALQAVQERGAVNGVILAVRRLARCHPWSLGGVDDVPARSRSTYLVTPFGFVVPRTQRKA